MKKILTCVLAFILFVGLIWPVGVEGAEIKEVDLGIKKLVEAEGQYINWDGVPSVAQFTDEKGNFCFAYVAGKKIIVVPGRGVSEA